MTVQVLLVGGVYIVLGHWLPDGAIMLVIAYAFGAGLFAGFAAVEGEFTFEERIVCIAVTHAVFWLIAALCFVLFMHGVPAPEMHFRLRALKFTFIFIGLPIMLALWAIWKVVVAVLRKSGWMP